MKHKTTSIHNILKTYVNNISREFMSSHMHIKCGNKRDINPKGIFPYEHTHTHTFYFEFEEDTKKINKHKT